MPSASVSVRLVDGFLSPSVFASSALVGKPSPSSSRSWKSGRPSLSWSGKEAVVPPLSGSKASSTPSLSVSLPAGVMSALPSWLASLPSMLSSTPSPSLSVSKLSGLPSLSVSSVPLPSAVSKMPSLSSSKSSASLTPSLSPSGRLSVASK